MSVHEILSLIACAKTQISLRTFKVSPELSCTDTYIHVDKWHTLQVYFLPVDETRHLQEKKSVVKD